MRRLFWVSVGAAAGYYAARKIPPAVARTRERGIAGNASLVASSAAKAVSSTRAAFTTPAPVTSAPSPSTSPTGDEPSTARREVRP
jgi:hypothetical protein